MLNLLSNRAPHGSLNKNIKLCGSEASGSAGKRDAISTLEFARSYK